MSVVALERPVLRYFGGKWRLAPWIIEHLPVHQVYVEPFGGGGSVLMRKPQSYAEIYNDLDTRVVSVFKVLRDPEQAKRLKELLELTPFSRSDFKEAFENSDDVVEQARRTIYRAFAAVGSDSAVNDRKTTGFRGVVLSRSPASNEWDTYRPCVDVFTERLRRVIIENREASWILDKHDSIETLFYVDPPYAMETRNEKNNYKFEMTNEDHEALLYQLVQLRGMVLLSGYPTPKYEAVLGAAHGWKSITTTAHADGGPGDRMNTARTEVLWLNPAAMARQAQSSFF